MIVNNTASLYRQETKQQQLKNKFCTDKFQEKLTEELAKKTHFDTFTSANTLSATYSPAFKDSYSLPENEKYRITKASPEFDSDICIYDKDSKAAYYFKEGDLNFQTDEVSGLQFLITTHERFPVLINEDLKAVLEDYSAITGKQLKQVPLQDYKVYTNEANGIRYLSKQQGKDVMPLLISEDDKQKFQGIIKEYLKYPGLCPNYELAEFRASLEVGGMMERVPGGFLEMTSQFVDFLDTNGERQWRVLLDNEHQFTELKELIKEKGINFAQLKDEKLWKDLLNELENKGDEEKEDNKV